jgi:hypothetical protein
VTSLYAAGRAEYRSSPEDPSPGVPSITAVRPQLNTNRLDQVVEIDPDHSWVVVQSRCSLAALTAFLSEHGLVLEAGSNQTRVPPTVGAAVIAGTVQAVWVDLLAKDGRITRATPSQKKLAQSSKLQTSSKARATGAASWDGIADAAEGPAAAHPPTDHAAPVLPPDCFIVAAALSTKPLATD